MTDNEIIKALEICSHRNGDLPCEGCPAYSIAQMCMEDLMSDAFDLINRQQAEIERLEKENEFCHKTITENAQRALEVTVEAIETAKSETIKEFAEELEYFVLNEDIEVVEPKCKDYESYINGANQFRHQIKNGINNIIKEMTEVEE